MWAWIALVSFLAGVSFAPAVLEPNLHLWGSWLSDYLKSPGIAVIAALIALFGISRQVAVSRETLKHNRDSDADTSWWRSFEWAASRALPDKDGGSPLPADVIISTLQSLARSATTDVQRVACAGLIDALAPRVVNVGENSSGGETTGSSTNAAFLALRSYVNASNGTTASSPTAEATVREYETYKNSVLAALLTLPAPIRVFREPEISNSKADAVVMVGDKRVALEVSYARTPSVVRARSNAAAQLRQDPTTAPLVLVSRFDSPFADGAASTKRVVVVKWNSPADNETLRQALEEAAQL